MNVGSISATIPGNSCSDYVKKRSFSFLGTGLRIVLNNSIALKFRLDMLFVKRIVKKK